jgi:CO/xanthine dehydrogenase FAD-binding subunit
LSEALALLSNQPGEWKPFAGGTDLMVLFEAGKLAHRKFVSLHGLRELQGIREEKDALVLGASVTYSELQQNAVARREFPNLVAASAETGALAIQNRGTFGGNIANASPAADSSPALLSYGAEVELVSSQGKRRVPYDRFHLGYKKLAMEPTELVLSIRLPHSGGTSARHYYRKIGTRRAQAISKVCMAAWARVEGGRVADLRLALGSVGPIPLRCPKTEAVLRGAAKGDAAVLGRARDALSREIQPIDDIRSVASYRREVALNLLSEFYDVELGR